METEVLEQEEVIVCEMPDGDTGPSPCPQGYRWDYEKKKCVADPG